VPVKCCRKELVKKGKLPAPVWLIRCYSLKPSLKLRGQSVAYNTCYIDLNIRDVQSLVKMPDIGFYKKPEQSHQTKLMSKFKNRKLKLPQFGFQKPTSEVWDGFSRCLILSSSSNMIGSTVKDSKYLSSCHISVLLVLSHFSWQLAGPIQHGSMSFLVSYRKNSKLESTQKTAYALNNTRRKTEPKNWSRS